MPGGRSRVKTTVNTSDLLLLIEQTEVEIFYDHFLELLCWQVARRSRVKTTVNTSSANGRASYYCADYKPSLHLSIYLATPLIWCSSSGSIVDDEEAVLEEEVEEQRQDHYALLVRAWEAKVFKIHLLF